MFSTAAHLIIELFIIGLLVNNYLDLDTSSQAAPLSIISPRIILISVISSLAASSGKYHTGCSSPFR